MAAVFTKVRREIEWVTQTFLWQMLTRNLCLKV